jgi:hypothetical protein
MHLMLLKWPRGGLHMVSVFCFPGLPRAPTWLPALFPAVAIDLRNKNT